MTSEQIVKIENKLQYKFSNKQLLFTAFTHSSYAKQAKVNDNERLEFLGDTILDMVVSEYLFDKFDACSVNALSTMRSNIVSAEGLRPIIDELNVMCFLQVGYGAASIKSASLKLASNLYEAIVAAIFLDGGFDSAKLFVLNTLSKPLNEACQRRDSKTLLQEYCQNRKKPSPKYIESGRAGAANNPTFKVDLYIGDDYMCSGEGHRKKDAEQDAAKKIVTKWSIE